MSLFDENLTSRDKWHKYQRRECKKKTFSTYKRSGKTIYEKKIEKCPNYLKNALKDELDFFIYFLKAIDHILERSNSSV